MSDNEHATAPLGNSEPLSVKNAVGEPIPQFCQVAQDESEVSPVIDGQKAGDVFAKKPAGTLLAENACHL
jgi:hypothetical protein